MLQGPRAVTNTVHELPSRITAALGTLKEAVEFSEETSGDWWEFAVEMELLTSMGLHRNDFRWLVRKGWVEHQRETTVVDTDGRTFCVTGDLSFPPGSCFVLTEIGAAFAEKICGSGPLAASATSSLPGDPTKPLEQARARVPDWDAEKRELRMLGTVVKRFKWQAMNQEIVLAAFQEEGWPARIDDPLPPKPEQDSRRRLSDTIKCLNRKQTHKLIRFRGDGTGEGVIWEDKDEPGRDGT